MLMLFLQIVGDVADVADVAVAFFNELILFILWFNNVFKSLDVAVGRNKNILNVINRIKTGLIIKNIYFMQHLIE